MRINSLPTATLDDSVHDRAAFPGPGFSEEQPAFYAELRIKKNWLFIGHLDAGWRSAVICSLLITARRYGLDPAAWLTVVLRRIPPCTSANLAKLLPWNWKPQTA